MFFRKTPEPKDPEPSDEQLQEEQDFADRNAVAPNPKRARSITTETQEIVQNTLDELDKAIQEKRALKEQAKKVQESCNEASGILRLRKA